MKQALLLCIALTSLAFCANAQSGDDIKIDTIDLTTHADKLPKVFTSVQSNPIFPGGYEEFYKYVGQNIHIPAHLYIRGQVLIIFSVDTSGQVMDTKILKGIVTKGMSKEIIRVFTESPKWQPAIQNGKPVKAYLTIPLNF